MPLLIGSIMSYLLVWWAFEFGFVLSLGSRNRVSTSMILRRLETRDNKLIWDSHGNKRSLTSRQLKVISNLIMSLQRFASLLWLFFALSSSEARINCPWCLACSSLERAKPIMIFNCETIVAINSALKTDGVAFFAPHYKLLWFSVDLRASQQAISAFRSPPRSGEGKMS